MMTGSGEGNPLAAGGPARHIPVLLPEALAALDVQPGGAYVDGTFGAGGYTRALLDAAPDVRVLAVDRDQSAVLGGYDLVQAAGGRLTLLEDHFSRLDVLSRQFGLAPLDGVVLDIGVSSMQFDQGERGFSFRHDGPLDMRMGGDGISAADLVNGESEERLADIFYYFGEERLSRLIAKTIVKDRREAPFESTKQLAEMIGRIVHTKPGDIHPATRVFQALRIAVNDELGELVRALHAAEDVLKPGGRLAVVTFHSLEDRIVKQFLAARAGRGGGSRHAPVAAVAEPSFRIAGKWPVAASAEESAANPRARSAKLRAGIRSDAPAPPLDDALLALASLPEPRNGRRT